MSRTVVWVSAGAASAVAAKLVLAGEAATLAYIDPGSEHEDNARFLDDLETWYGQRIERLRSARYADTWQVFSERRFLNSPFGALCTTELKKRVRQDFTRPDDVQVFGYTIDGRAPSNVATPANGTSGAIAAAAEPLATGEFDAWNQPRILPTGVPNPNYGRTPDHWVHVEPWGDTRGLTAQSVGA